MDLLEAIRSRRSIRKYQSKPIPADVLQQILAAAMYAPSACNCQPWEFVVIDDPAILAKIPAIHPYAPMAGGPAAAILVCGDRNREKIPGYWVVDCSAAVQNLLLATHGAGLGAVWCGVYPQEPRMADFRRLLGLPESVMPHSLVPIGYPAEQPTTNERFQPGRIHRNGW